MQFWKRKAAARDAARPVLARVLQGASLGDWPRSYEGQAREALANPVAQRAVRLIAESVAAAPLTGDPAALALTPSDLLEAVAAQVLLHGNAFVQIAADSAGAPAELFALRPERVAIEPDARGWPVAYHYRVGAAETRLAADEVVHIKAFHPADDHYGLGCLGAAAGAIAIHNAATRWNKALLDNAARPSGALVYAPKDGTPLSGPQFDRLRAELEEGFAGSANAGRPMVLDGGVSWQAMSLTPADMDFVALKATAAREIALAFGVPPMLLGLPGDNTYANYREANRALWRLAVLPLAGKILGALATRLGGALAVDIDRVSALAEERERLWRMVSGAPFLSDDAKRAVLGL